MEGDRPEMTAKFVVDTSIVCSWVLPDESSSVAAAAFVHLQTSDAIAPDLLWHEVRNVLMMARKRNRIEFDKACEGVKLLRGLSIFTRRSSSDDMILDLAERHQLTAYDAAYLALAIESKLPLATLDKQLIAAAARENVPLLS
ncbi:type II toxin-antitoxin system VapC family toxin [Rhizobium sp. RAF36]|uniref:type II toxin-antitoxin system VapC family toxin n=1 Tax=Rhizobium sp. RAF36 TaxID=3233055 RepID=UPI003F9C5018